MISKLSKFILLSSPVAYACVYTCVVFLISVLVQSIDIPSSSFLSVCDIIEQIANYLWYIVSIVLFVFVFIVRLAFANGKILIIIPSLLRIILNLIIFISFSILLHFLSNEFNRCSDNDYDFSNSKLGQQRGFFWHVLTLWRTSFITCFATLVVLEESSVYREWETVQEIKDHKFESYFSIDNYTEIFCDNPEGFQDVENLAAIHDKFNLLIKILSCLLLAIIVALHLDNIIVIILWSSPSWMVTVTIIPVVVWLFTYRLVYNMKFCNLSVNSDKRRIEEFFYFIEESTERNNLIEEIMWKNDVKGDQSIFSKFLSRIFRKSYSYDNL